MGDRSRRLGVFLGLGAAVALAAATAGAAEPNIKSLAAGLTYENLSRTVVWKDDAASSKIRGQVISARADLGLAKGVVVSLSAGLVLTDYQGLAFTALPITLAYGSSPLKGLAFGAEVAAPLARFSNFEIGAAGRFVYSFGMSKTWALEGFSVEGRASGRSSWMEASAGPRLTYLALRGITPYVEVSARWLHAGFRMTESLGDLHGTETKRVGGDFSVSVALGADVALTDRLSLKAKAGVLPHSGGVDALMSAGFAYSF